MLDVHTESQLLQHASLGLRTKIKIITQKYSVSDPHNTKIKIITQKYSVSDPHWFQCGCGSILLPQCGSRSRESNGQTNADPDPGQNLLLNPDPHSQYGSGSRRDKSMRFDPKHCKNVSKYTMNQILIICVERYQYALPTSKKKKPTNTKIAVKWIQTRIYFGRQDPDPDPDGQKWPTQKEKVNWQISAKLRNFAEICRFFWRNWMKLCLQQNNCMGYILLEFATSFMEAQG